MPSAFLTEARRGLWHLVPPDAADVAVRPVAETTDLPPVANDDDLDRVLRDYLNVKLPNERCCQGHRTPWEAVHDAFFARSSVAIWKASRGLGGKSFTMSALGLAEALFLRADVNILGGTGEQSKRVLESIGALWEVSTAPRQCLRGEPGSQKQKLVWGNRIVALMASQASVRGPHPQRLRLDEVDEMKWTILDSALGQPMSKGWVMAQVVLSSTHQYSNGTMSKVLAMAGGKGWPVFEWCYRENLEPHGWLSMAEVSRKQAIMTTAAWDTEVELQEPSSEGRAIDPGKSALAFDESLALTPVTIGAEYAELEAPVAGARYGTGADWAKKVNKTAIVTMRFDVTPAVVVAVRWVNKLPWPAIVALFEAQVLRYPGPAIHDNTGLGQVVHDLLNVQADPFDMVGKKRADLLSEYIAAIEHDEIRWPRLDSCAALAAARSEHIYCTRDDIYRGTKDGSGRFHLPDTVSAGAFAWRTRTLGTGTGTAVDRSDPGGRLSAGFQVGRLSAYVRGQGQLPGDDDADDTE